jgi:hypothetical protein
MSPVTDNPVIVPDHELGEEKKPRTSEPPRIRCPWCGWSRKESAKPHSTVRLKNANVATTKATKLAKVGWLALRSETENTMSNSISTLLLRNLSDVFGENEPMRRRAAIDEIFHEDAVFYDPKGGVFRGRDEIDRIAGVLKATHPDFEYQPLFPPEELGDAGRVRWVSGTPGKPPAYAGTDFIVARNGRIASIYLFFDNLP